MHNRLHLAEECIGKPLATRDDGNFTIEHVREAAKALEERLFALKV